MPYSSDVTSGSRYDAGGKYNTIGGMAANMIEEYTFKVEYLGSLMLSKTATGLAAIQKPLRELYLNNIRKSDTKIQAQERTIKVRPEGILMIFKDSSGSGQAKHVFYEMSSIHFKDSVTFVTRRGSDKKLRGGFEPLEEHRRGSADGFFTMLDKKFYYLSDKRHPALFVCVMRRPLGVKALDCHVFVMANHKEAVQIVDIINQLQCKEVASVHESSKTLPYHQSGGNGVEITKLPAFRPTDHPAQQTTGQRYELRDEFFRPNAYDAYNSDNRQKYRNSSDTRSNLSNEVSMQPSGVTVFHNTVDDFGRPTQPDREDAVRLRHPGNRNLNTSFDDRKYLSVNTSFDDDKRRPNGNLSFDETRRPFSMFQEGYDRRAEVVSSPPGYGQRYSPDDSALGGRSPVGGRGNLSTPINRSLSPIPRTAPKPDRNSQPVSPISKGNPSTTPSSPGWGPVASMSNLESRQELERGKRISDPPVSEVQEEKSRPIAKVPPHLVAGVKVLPTEFKVPLRKTSPQASPRCEDPNRYNNLSVNPNYDDDYRLKGDYPMKNNHDNRNEFQYNNYNNQHNSQQQSHNRNNSSGNYGDHGYKEIPYNHGGPGNHSFQGVGSSPKGYRDQSYNYNKAPPYDNPPHHQGNRFNDSQEWGYREGPYRGQGYGSRGEPIRDPATGEMDKPPGSLKDKEIASLVSNIYIGPNSNVDTNFEQSLGYYP
ncbi:uncharacterized protein LOC135476256 isoform X3 [Liolophura sinensis]|uniref:uncharacterized protein LOC135476256 isoform X3 n=1 Tax=Liolophura sinensis TaxID=3198878 RepID=UPI0031599461